MRTQSAAKVKHQRTARACIDHCSREVCNALYMPDERDDALDPARRDARHDESRDAIDERDAPLRDGRYDAFILSAETRANGVALSCTITSGEHRGDVIDIV